MYCLELGFSTFLLAFVHILLQIEANPVEMC